MQLLHFCVQFALSNTLLTLISTATHAASCKYKYNEKYKNTALALSTPVLTLISAAALFSCRQSAGGLSRAAGSQAKALETELISKLKLKLKLKHKLSSGD